MKNHDWLDDPSSPEFRAAMSLCGDLGVPPTPEALIDLQGTMAGQARTIGVALGDLWSEVSSLLPEREAATGWRRWGWCIPRLFVLRRDVRDGWGVRLGRDSGVIVCAWLWSPRWVVELRWRKLRPRSTT